MARAIKTRSTRRGPSARNAKQQRVHAIPGWTIRRAGGLQIVESRALGQLDWLVHGFSTRLGGESVLDKKRTLNLGFTDWDVRERVAANRAKFMAALPARKMSLSMMQQFHSDVIYVGSPGTELEFAL